MAVYLMVNLLQIISYLFVLVSMKTVYAFSYMQAMLLIFLTGH